MSVKDKILAFSTAALCLTLPHCASLNSDPVFGTFVLNQNPQAYVFSKTQMDQNIKDGQLPIAVCVGNTDKLLMVTSIVAVGEKLDTQQQLFPDSQVLTITPPMNALILRHSNGTENVDIAEHFIKIARPENVTALNACIREYIHIMGGEPKKPDFIPPYPEDPIPQQREFILPYGTLQHSAARRTKGRTLG